MILIYENEDLTAEGKTVGFRAVNVQHVHEDRRQVIAEGYAETIYIETSDGMFTMVKQRNGPIDPYPCIIEYKRAAATRVSLQESLNSSVNTAFVVASNKATPFPVPICGRRCEHCQPACKCLKPAGHREDSSCDFNC